mgnify:CR=1 FL=1
MSISTSNAYNQMQISFLGVMYKKRNYEIGMSSNASHS